MIKLRFEMKPFDFDNVKNVIGPFHLDNKDEEDLYFEIINEIEFGTFGIGFDYEVEEIENEEFIVINHRISYELDSIIRDILGQEEDE